MIAITVSVVYVDVLPSETCNLPLPTLSITVETAGGQGTAELD